MYGKIDGYLKGNIVELKLKSVKPTLPIFVRFSIGEKTKSTLAFVDYAYDSVEIPDTTVFDGVEGEGRVCSDEEIDSLKREILASMDYDPAKVPSRSLPQMAWMEIDKVRKGEYKSIFKDQYKDFGPGPNEEEEKDGV